MRVALHDAGGGGYAHVPEHILRAPERLAARGPQKLEDLGHLAADGQ